jgi:hypothetical protein
LVVANRTAESPELLEALKKRSSDGECQFTLLVPATPHGIAWAADMFAGGDEAEQHRSAFVQELRDEGIDVTDDDRRRIYAPAGLDLGAEGPEEIAAAIVAEIVAIRRGRRGGFLRDRATPIHDRPTASTPRSGGS